MALSMRFSEKLSLEKEEGHSDIVCPDGFGTYRPSRFDEE
jgi:hypothetical protein